MLLLTIPVVEELSAAKIAVHELLNQLVTEALLLGFHDLGVAGGTRIKHTSAASEGKVAALPGSTSSPDGGS
jgi:hypothetical protein